MTRLAIAVTLLASAWWALPGCNPDPAAEDDPAAEATPEVQAALVAEDGAAGAAADGATDGKTANPGRETLDTAGSDVTWEEAPLELGFNTKKGWQVFTGQGACKPPIACQQLKAVREGEEKPLATRTDVSDLVSLVSRKEQAEALVRFFTDHRHALSDEDCSELGLTDEGELDLALPDDVELEAPLPAHPVKVVDFEGGFRVERTLLCTGEEKDRVVWVAETVFTPGNWTREEVEVLLEHEGLVKRLK